MGQEWGPGSVVASRFRLEDLLDERAGARFWRATDLTLARNVAIHVLPSADRRSTALLTAARTSATVTDPHLLRVLDAVEEDGVVHVVHEWGSGQSLDRMVAEEPLDPRRAAWLVREVAQAITATHAQGVAHGRLLPENVLVTDSGSVKLIGFVVDAVLYGRITAEEAGLDDPPGEHENDVRNLGALLYAALTGRWPGLPRSVVPDAPLDHGQVCRPRQVRAGVPRDLDALCGRLLRRGGREVRDGSVTAASVADALGRFLGDDAPGSVAGLAGLGALGGLGGFEPVGGASDADGLSADPGLAADVRRSHDDPEATQAAPLAGAGPATAGDHDPEATQLSPVARDDRDGPDATATRTVRTAPSTGRPAPPAAASGSPVAPPRSPWLGMGAGEVPDDWGPDHDGTGPLPVVRPEPERPGGHWMRLGAALAGLLLLALVAVVVTGLGGPDLVPGGAGGSDESASPSATPRPQPVQIASVSDFDPSGDPPEENPDEAPLAADGNPATAWRTSTYFDGPALAPFKPGVGLLLDLGEETDVRDVSLQLVGQGYAVQLLAAGEGAGAPTSVQGLTKVAAATGAGPKVTLTPRGAVTTRYLVVWLTALPSVEGGYQGQVAEVVVRS